MVGDITIKLDDATNVRAGMNADAEILIENVTNVVKVPLEAITTRNGKSYVTVVSSDNSRSNTQNVNSNSWSKTRQRSQRLNSNTKLSQGKTVEITIGINDEEYAQVLSGLNEGDIVVLPRLASSSSKSSETSTKSMNGMGMRAVTSMDGPPSGGMGR
jgi:HlyD family secretion protein